MKVSVLHHLFKDKLNKLDSEQNRNLKIPQIDLLLNEAQDLFIRLVAEPRIRARYGFEKNQRTIDDIRQIVVSPDEGYMVEKYTEDSYIATLPDDYKYLIRSYVRAKKGECFKDIRCFAIQQDDMPEESPFYKSSFEWSEVNFHFFEDKVRLYTDETFEIQSYTPSYIREPKYIHYAAGYQDGGYRIGGKNLTGTQDCELSESAQREIVDLAAALAAGNIEMPEYQYKTQKLAFDELVGLNSQN